VTSSSRPYVSVVIPCRNGGDTLARQLRALTQQVTSFSFEVVVADNGSTDHTVDVAESFGAIVRVVDASRAAGINIARNDGVRGSYGELVLLCDSDDEVQQGWIQAYAQEYRRGAYCMAGPFDRVDDSGIWLESVDALQVHRATRRRYPIGANCAFSRSAFDEIGGFDERFAGGADEIDFFWRAEDNGYPLLYVPAARINYYMRADVRSRLRQHMNFGKGNMRLDRKYLSPGRARVEVIKSVARMPRWIMQLALNLGSADGRSSALQWIAYERGMISEFLRGGHA